MNNVALDRPTMCSRKALVVVALLVTAAYAIIRHRSEPADLEALNE